MNMNYVKTFRDGNEAIAKSYRDLERSVEASAKRMANAQIREAERASKAISRMGGGGGGGSPFGGGFGRGRMMAIRGASMLLGAANIPGGSIIRSGIGGAEIGWGAAGNLGGAAGGGLAGMAIAGTIAEVKLTGEIIETAIHGFREIVMGPFMAAANSIASAVLTIGGWKGVAGGLVSAASAERIAAENIGVVPHGAAGGFTPGTNAALFNRLSAGTEFSPEDVGRAQRAWADTAGELPGFAKNFDVLNKVASILHKSLFEVSEEAGNLRKIFSDVNDADFRKIYLGLLGGAESGAVPMQEMGTLSRALGSHALLAGDVGANAATIGALAQITAPGMRRGQGPSGAGAGTAIAHIIADMVANPGNYPGVKIAGGQVANFQQALVANAVGLMHGGGHTTAATAPFYAELEAGVKRGDRQEEANQINEKIEAQKRETENIQSINEKFKDVASTTEYQLKVAFLEISQTLNKDLFPIIKEKIVPKLKQFADLMEKEGIKSFADVLSATGEQLGKLLPDLITVFGDLGMASSYLLVSFLAAIKTFALLPGVKEAFAAFGIDINKDLDTMAKTVLTLNTGFSDLITTSKNLAVKMNAAAGGGPGELAHVPIVHHPALSTPAPHIGGGGGGGHADNQALIRLLQVHLDKQNKVADRQIQAADKIIANPAMNRAGVPIDKH
jgi:hypothetical protein